MDLAILIKHIIELYGFSSLLYAVGLDIDYQRRMVVINLLLIGH